VETGVWLKCGGNKKPEITPTWLDLWPENNLTFTSEQTVETTVKTPILQYCLSKKLNLTKLRTGYYLIIQLKR